MVDCFFFFSYSWRLSKGQLWSWKRVLPGCEVLYFLFWNGIFLFLLIFLVEKFEMIKKMQWPLCLWFWMESYPCMFCLLFEPNWIVSCFLFVIFRLSHCPCYCLKQLVPGIVLSLRLFEPACCPWDCIKWCRYVGCSRYFN